MAPQRSDIGVLRCGARAHRPLAQVDLLEARLRSRGVVIKQRALRDRKPDRAFDVGARSSPRLIARKVPEDAARLLAASRDAMVTWLPRWSATTRSRRSIKAGSAVLTEQEEASLLSPKASELSELSPGGGRRLSTVVRNGRIPTV
jgi:hypothetical protein